MINKMMHQRREKERRDKRNEKKEKSGIHVVNL